MQCGGDLFAGLHQVIFAQKNLAVRRLQRCHQRGQLVRCVPVGVGGQVGNGLGQFSGQRQGVVPLQAAVAVDGRIARRHDEPGAHGDVCGFQPGGIAPQRDKYIGGAFLNIAVLPRQDAAGDDPHQRGVVPHSPPQPGVRVLPDRSQQRGCGVRLHELQLLCFWRLSPL